MPTATPTETPTVLPTEAPTTATPSELPTAVPTKMPTGCLVRGAKMHVLFKEDIAGRRLLTKIGAFYAQTNILQVAVATELNIPVSDLTATSYAEAGGVIHTELMFKGLESVKLAFTLEEKVMSNQFNPIPGYPIRRLYVEEIFDCGRHAVQATHSQLIDPNLKFAVSDIPNGGFVHH